MSGDEGPRVQMAVFGTISEFVEGNQDWLEYEERLGIFFLALECVWRQDLQADEELGHTAETRGDPV